MLDCFLNEHGYVCMNDERRDNPGDPVVMIDPRDFVELARFLLNADQALECETRIRGEIGAFLED